MSDTLLRAENLSFGYLPNQLLIENWDAEFRRGEMTALTGPSGRGKSTLLYLLGLMLAPNQGQITVANQNAATLPDAKRAALRAQHFGFVFQDAALDSTRTVLDNVTEPALYRGITRKSMYQAALEKLAQFEVDVPPSRKPGQVSGGQAQRIALCRALLTNPKIVLADEPTGNLDPASARIVVEALQHHAKEGNTVIIVTHTPEIAEVCDREIRL